jgi:hypothetical protein
MTHRAQVDEAEIDRENCRCEDQPDHHNRNIHAGNWNGRKHHRSDEIRQRLDRLIDALIDTRRLLCQQWEWNAGSQQYKQFIHK